VSFSVGAKRAGHDAAAPFKKEIRPRLLRSTGRPEVRALTELVDGRLLTVRTRTRICRD
jgi:hypothetical protein